MKPRFGIYFFIGMRLLLGAIFIAASIDKIAHPAKFAEIVQNYQILPDYMVNIASIVLPWLEALLGALILFGWWLPGATAIASLLLVVFMAALSSPLRAESIHTADASAPVPPDRLTHTGISRATCFYCWFPLM